MAVHRGAAKDHSITACEADQPVTSVATDKGWGDYGRIFTLAVAINYPWELAQSSLYIQPQGTGAMLWHCGLASLGDGVMVLAIVVARHLPRRRGGWLLRPDTRGYLVMLATGLVLSVAVEWVALRVLGWWAYSPRMPLLPMLGIGVAPVVQMLVLPALVAYLAAMRRGQVGGKR